MSEHEFSNQGSIFGVPVTLGTPFFYTHFFTLPYAETIFKAGCLLWLVAAEFYRTC